VGGQHHTPATLPLGTTQYPLYRRLGGPQGQPGRGRKIAPPPGFDPRTVQPIASRYTDWATWPTIMHGTNIKLHNNIQALVKKYGVFVWVWTGVMWYKIGVSVSFSEQVYDPLGCTKVGNYFVSSSVCQLLKDSAPPTEFVKLLSVTPLIQIPVQAPPPPEKYLFKIHFNPYMW
jgi:hypothetical protein